MGGDHDERHRPVPQTGAEDKSVPATHEERVLVVGKGVVLTADVTSCEDVIVEGCFHGNIKAKTFVLAEGESQLDVPPGKRFPLASRYMLNSQTGVRSYR